MTEQSDRAEVSEIEERAARLVCSATNRKADDICYFLGEGYGKPFWMSHLSTARVILGLQLKDAEIGKKLAAALQLADAQFGFSKTLIRLVDGVHTFRLEIDGNEYTYTDDVELDASDACYAHIARSRAAARSVAILSALGMAGE